MKTVINVKATTAGATANVETLLNGTTNVVMPSWARELVDVSPYIASDSTTVNLCQAAKLVLKSDDVAITPYEVLCNPVSGYDATDGICYHAPIETYEVHCPLKGGEEIQVYGTTLTSYTGEVYVGATLTVADHRTGRQRFSKVGTYTGSGTSAAEVAGTAYTIHGSEKLIEAYGMLADIVKAAANMISGHFRLASNDFKVAVPLKFGCNPISGAIGTVDGPLLNGPSRVNLSIPTNTTCSIQDYCYFDLAPTAAGNFITGVAFYKVGRD